MAKTGHPNFVLSYQCTWRGILKNWSVTSSHSGATLSAPQALTFLQAVDAIIKGFMSASATDVFLDRYAYYDGQASAPLQEADYETKAASIAAGWEDDDAKGLAYVTGSAGVCGAETCVVLQAPVGESSTNKPVVLRHWVHNVPPSTTDGDTPPFSTNATALAVQLGDGTLPGNRVLISSSGKQGVWVPNTSFGAHKMSRRWTKSTAANVLSIAGALNDLKKAGLALVESDA